MTQPSLVRQLTTLSATALVVSNMIGVGIFTTTGFLAGDLGDPWLVIGIWFVGAALALAGALSWYEADLIHVAGHIVSSTVVGAPMDYIR